MAKTTFHPTSKNIGELLGGNERAKLVVPAFQRGYSWEKKHVAAFWKDIIDLQKDDSREKHFLGPIVILTKPKDVIELLDGQQRLATATILFSVLRDIAQEKASDRECQDFARDVQTQFILKEGTSGYSLDMGETDRLYFREAIQSFPAGTKKPTRRSHHKIQAAQRFLMDAAKRHHCCPAIRRIDSTDWGHQIDRLGIRMGRVPVKWAFSQKASRSKSVESGRG